MKPYPTTSQLSSDDRPALGRPRAWRLALLLATSLLVESMLAACRIDPSMPVQNGVTDALQPEADGLVVSPRELKGRQQPVMGTEAIHPDPVFDPLFAKYFSDLDAVWNNGQIDTTRQYHNLKNKGRNAQAYIAAHDIDNAYHALKALLNELHAAAGNQVLEPEAGILIDDVEEIIQALNDQAATAPPDTPVATSTPTTDTVVTPAPTSTPIPVEMTASAFTSVPATTTPPPMPAQTITPAVGSCTGTPMVPRLTVWSEPSLESTRLGFIEPGEIYLVFDYVNTSDDTQFLTRFYQIGYQGVLAWTPAMPFQLSGDCSAIPTPVFATLAPPSAPLVTRAETWTLLSMYVMSDPCSGAATGDVSVPITLEFDEGTGMLLTLSWYSRVWQMHNAQTDGRTWVGAYVLQDTEIMKIEDNIEIRFTSPQAFEGGLTRIVTIKADQLTCIASYKWYGRR